MDAGSSGSTDLLRLPVSVLEYPGRRSEIVIGDDKFLLLVVDLDLQSERGFPLAEIRIPLFDFVERQGRKIQFCSMFSGFSAGSIDFAGMGGTAWFHVTCDDEASAVIVTERIGQRF